MSPPSSGLNNMSSKKPKRRLTFNGLHGVISREDRTLLKFKPLKNNFTGHSRDVGPFIETEMEPLAS
jgi:hypothetical protein